MTRQLCFGTLLILLTLPAAKAAAQFAEASEAGGPPSVSGAGSALVERQADTLRMNVDLLAKGSNLKDALARLHDRRKAAEEQLKKLGANAKSVRFSPPHISAGQNDQQAQMQMMIQQQMMQRRGGRRAAEKPAVALPVTVAMPLVAEWPLKADQPEALLLAAHELEEQIKAADLGGRTAAEELTPEEQELVEEAESEMDAVYYDGEQAPKPGEPRFVYVSKISDDQRAKAFSEAYERAKASAEQLAKAASVELGALQHLSGGGDSGLDSESYEDWGPYGYQMMQRMQRVSTGDDVEAVGPRPDSLKYHVHVTASFALK